MNILLSMNLSKQTANIQEIGQDIERLEEIGDLIITVVHVYSRNRESSFHVTSFIKIRDKNYFY